MPSETNMQGQPEAIATEGEPTNPVFSILNGLLGAVWRASAQHQAHIALIEVCGLQGLASAKRTRTAQAL